MEKGHGGKRKGAGRKRKAEIYAPKVNATEGAIAAKLPKIGEELVKKATDGEQIVEDTYEAAGTITIDGFEKLEDEDGKERIVKVKKLAFPDKAKTPEELVLVKRVIKNLPTDQKAIEYAIDRIAGKPGDSDEMKVRETVEAELEAFYALMEKSLDPETWERICGILSDAA